MATNSAGFTYGGDQSFAVALTDQEGNGVVVSSLHSRDVNNYVAIPKEGKVKLKGALAWLKELRPQPTTVPSARRAWLPLPRAAIATTASSPAGTVVRPSVFRPPVRRWKDVSDFSGFFFFVSSSVVTAVIPRRPADVGLYDFNPITKSYPPSTLCTLVHFKLFAFFQRDKGFLPIRSLTREAAKTLDLPQHIVPAHELG